MTEELLDSQCMSSYAHTHTMETFTIRLSLFGIPIAVHPSIFLILMLLGGGLDMGEATQLTYALLFVVAGFLCLLTHELGHALTAKLGYGASTSILVAWTGGVTQAVPPPPTRQMSIAMTLAGPLATLVPGAIALLLLSLQLGGDFSAGWRILAYFSLPFTDEGFIDGHVSAESFEALAAVPLRVLQLYALLCKIGIFWALFNILPIFPLDGGQLLLATTNRIRLSALVGIATCLLAGTALSIYTASAFNAMLFLLLAWYNYRLYKSSAAS